MISFCELGRWGRLGNQMYEYAALLGIGAELGHDVAIAPLDEHALGSCFTITAPILTRRDRSRIKHHFHEPRVGFSDRYRAIVDRTDLTGHFQSERYFPDRAVVTAELSFRPELRAEADDLVGTLRDGDRPLVGVTVRRGDYLLNPAQFRSLSDTDYYDRAFALVREHTDGNATFVVSSDEPDWCRSHLAGPDVTVIDGVADPLQLALLTRCDHLVIANSSFAWWGAWLNEEAELRIAAATWWGENGVAPEAERDPLPAGWLELTAHDR